MVHKQEDQFWCTKLGGKKKFFLRIKLLFWIVARECSPFTLDKIFQIKKSKIWVWTGLTIKRDLPEFHENGII